MPKHEENIQNLKTEINAEQYEQGNETIMLVEDEPGMLLVIKLMLEKNGFTVLPANNPKDAIKLAELHAGEFHLLMSDVVMPDINGIELANILLERQPEIKCLLISGYVPDMITHKNLHTDKTHLLQKPFTMKTLIDKVREVLDKS